MGNGKQKSTFPGLAIRFVLTALLLAYACILNETNPGYLPLVAFAFPFFYWAQQLAAGGSMEQQPGARPRLHILTRGYLFVLIAGVVSAVYACLLNADYSSTWRLCSFIIPTVFFLDPFFESSSTNAGSMQVSGKEERRNSPERLSKSERLQAANIEIESLKTVIEQLQQQAGQQKKELERLKKTENTYNDAVRQARVKVAQEIKELTEALGAEKNETKALLKQLEDEKQHTGTLAAELEKQRTAAETLKAEKDTLAAQLAGQQVQFKELQKQVAEAAALRYDKLKAEKDELEKQLKDEIEAGKDTVQALNGRLNQVLADKETLSKERLAAGSKVVRYDKMLQYLKDARFIYLKNKKMVEITDFVRFSIIANDIVNDFSHETFSKNYSIVKEDKTTENLKDQTTRLTFNEAAVNKDLTCLIKWGQQHKEMLPDGKWDLFYDNKEIDLNIKF